MAIERELCPDCQCLTYEGNRTFGHREDGVMVELLHTSECPQFTIQLIMLEDGTRRVREKQDRSEAAFPAARDRLRAAAEEVADSSADAPFAAALSDLVQAQIDAGGGYVALDVWVSILDRHFPPPSERPES